MNREEDIFIVFLKICYWLGFPCGSVGNKSTCNVGDLGSIPRLGRSPGEGKGYPLQYSGLENSVNSTVHGGHKELDMTEWLSLSLSCYWLENNTSGLLKWTCLILYHLQPLTDWKRSVFIPIPKKGNAKECSNYRTVALISHASKLLLKILQARLQQ